MSNKTPKVICKLKGGLGNQLFIYAAARRLALSNNAELVIDQISGFEVDFKYMRKYMLHFFNIHARFASPKERLQPFNKIRRRFLIELSHRKWLGSKSYFIQNQNEFDPTFLNLRINSNIYIEGYWQSEKYFKDIEQIIRTDLIIKQPEDIENKFYGSKIKKLNSVCIHVRWFDKPKIQNGCDYSNNIDEEYYNSALSLINNKIVNPHYFIFSDYPNEITKVLNLPKGSTTIINHNKSEENAYADLWLMSQCKHFIIANSTFSWWGAWLSTSPDKIIIAPKKEKIGEGSWGFKGLLPEEWIVI